jgi:hypothetical protein
MDLEEISIAFKNCNGETNKSFKGYLLDLTKTPEDYRNGFIVSNANNYILSDVEKLLSKAILNICAVDYLIKTGYFNWGFVSSYYASYFSIQALNRLQINFNTWTHHLIRCENQNYVNQDIKICLGNSSNTHKSEFKLFFQNISQIQSKRVDRFWSIGLNRFSDGDEALLRNEINYSISEDYYYELQSNFSLSKFNKIINDNKKSPFEARESINDPVNYARKHLQISISRIRVICYILNHVANHNSEYQSYFKRNMNGRINSIKQKYPNLSIWMLELLNSWLLFETIEHD